MKKIFLLAAAFMLTVATSFADSGSYGSINWSIENDTLTISGSGALLNGAQAPWDARFDFQHVVIQDGITELGEGSFYHCGESILTIDIPASVTTINNGALVMNDNLTEIKVHWTENIPVMTSGYYGNYMGISENKVSGIKLSIPYDTFLQYQLSTGWMDFELEERDEDSNGIDDVTISKIPVAYYNIMGAPLQKEMKNGIYIVVYDDGSVEKRVR